jgi:hypothetical protein
VTEQTKWVGEEQLKAAFLKLLKEVDSASRLIVVKGASMVERQAKANVGPESHGKNEPRIGVAHPNVVTGYLRYSIRSDTAQRLGPGFYGIVVAPRAIYARRVELGYSGKKGKSRGYPFFIPAVTKVKPELEKMSQETWGKVFAK